MRPEDVDVVRVPGSFEKCLAGIRRLEPAHSLVVDLDNGTASEPSRYWELCPAETVQLPIAEAAARLRDQLKHLEGQGPAA